MQLSERTSAKGNRYLSGWLGKASVVAFPGEPDKHGNETWDLFVGEPQPRAGQQQSRPEARQDGPAKPPARPVERGGGRQLLVHGGRGGRACHLVLRAGAAGATD